MEKNAATLIVSREASVRTSRLLVGQTVAFVATAPATVVGMTQYELLQDNVSVTFIRAV